MSKFDGNPELAAQVIKYQSTQFDVAATVAYPVITKTTWIDDPYVVATPDDWIKIDAAKNFFRICQFTDKVYIDSFFYFDTNADIVYGYQHWKSAEDAQTFINLFQQISNSLVSQSIITSVEDRDQALVAQGLV